MKARDLLNPAYNGWDIEIDYVKGKLQLAISNPVSQDIEILVRNQDGFQGIKVHPDAEVKAEKSLEEQIKDDFADLKYRAVSWVKRKVR